MRRYNGCIVNGIRFHTKDHEKNLRTQNSGVVVKGDHQSNTCDFYGVITDIFELRYMYGKKVCLFKCDWWDVSDKKAGIQTRRGFTSVNIGKKWYQNDPYVLAIQANQVFYVSDTKLRGNWHVVQQIIPRNIYDVLANDQEIQEERNDGAYQEEHLVENLVLNEDVTIEQLNRTDVSSDDVDARIVMRSNTETYEMDDGVITVDDEDEEDATLIEYCSEEEAVTASDSDTDID